MPVQKKHKNCAGHSWDDYDAQNNRAKTQCEYCHVIQEEWLQYLETYIIELQAIQDELIKWVQHDCPFSYQEILSIATEDAKKRG